MSPSAFAVFTCTVAVLVLASCRSTSGSPSSLQARAEHLAQSALLVDGHIDLPHRLYEFYEDPAVPTVGGDFDYPRACSGGLDAPFMSIYIPTSLQDDPDAATERADTLIGFVERIAEQRPDKFTIATSPDDVRRIADTEALALPMGLENGAGLGGTLANIEHLYDRGVRYITLTHGTHNRIGDSSYDDAPTRWHGLSPFGETVIDEMNRLGLMIDVSHVTDATAADVLERTQAPVIASHSSCRHFTPGWERNVSDELIEGIAETEGLVMITFGARFLRDAYRTEDDALKEKTQAHIDAMDWAADAREAVVYEQKRRKGHPLGTVEDVADHIDHAVDLVGIEHVGLGSDFDGVFALPEGLQDVSDYPNLIAVLLRRGYTDDDLRQILGENLLRVWEMVTAVARSSPRS